ncbi:hypothetical protein [Herbidospora sp. NBRC 101105]|uniref:hypothetical protein n=1 Tax=Herbidospora sp. NBRC 101105 TaxID=3032195 RepID=UPI00255313EC|nr:hypothetical protein [Herbidospora sp. NBRC 101105]
MRRPAVCAALLTLVACGPSHEDLVLRSLPELERVAETIGPDASGKRTIAGIEFLDVYRFRDRVYFVTGEAVEGVDPFGYVWSPKKPPAHEINGGAASTFEHLRGEWYSWSASY